MRKKESKPPSSEEIREDLNDAVSRLTTGHQVVEQVSYGIWGAAITATRAFAKVVVKIDPGTNRVFVQIALRWWAKHKKLNPLKKAWLTRAENRCKEYMPEGFKLLVYYEPGSQPK